MKKLPRKLKKKLKAMICRFYPAWASSEVRIDGFEPYRFHFKRGVFSLNGKSVTAWRLLQK